MHIPYEVLCESAQVETRARDIIEVTLRPRRTNLDVHAREAMSLPRSHAEVRHRDKNQRAGNVISYPRILRHVNSVLSDTCIYTRDA
jgi:hypothetical protein